MAQTIPIAVGLAGSTVSILWGALLIVLGVMAIGAPFLAAVAVTAVIAWLIIVAGVVHIVLAFHAQGAGSGVWRALVGLAYLGFGGYMLFHPVVGVASLTLVLASLFVIEGVLNLMLYARTRALRGSSLMLIDAIVTLLLGAMIYLQWPSSSVWAIGILVGVSLMISGATRIGLTLAIRKATAGPERTRMAA